jgi:DNA-binding transcriptional ArsR family regulator
MTPLFHPQIEDVPLETVLHALSDPVRVAIFAQIAAAAAPCVCSTFLNVIDKPIPKSTLSLHFKALREAGLIRSERHGVEMRNVARCEEMNARFPGLLPAIIEAHQRQAEAREKPGERAPSPRLRGDG